MFQNTHFFIVFNNLSLSDQGCIVEGNHLDIPDRIKPCGSSPFDECYLYFNGLLEIRQSNVYRIPQKRQQGTFDIVGGPNDINYERFGGGWEFEYYKSCFYDVNGNEISCPPYLHDYFEN